MSESYIVIVRTAPLFYRHRCESAEEAARHVRALLENGALDDALHNQGHTVNAYKEEEGNGNIQDHVH